jgi:mannose PTS system EIIA component
VIGVLIVTHGHLGQELLNSAEGILGKQPQVRVLGLDSSEGPEAYQRKIQVVLSEMNSPAGVLVMADMMGGTPCNAALQQCRDPRINFDLVTGVNLPMLVSALTKRHHMPLEQLCQKIVQDGPRTVVRPIPILKKSVKPKEEN